MIKVHYITMNNDLIGVCINHATELKTGVHYFYQIFIYSPNDSPSKTMKNAFYFI